MAVVPQAVLSMSPYAMGGSELASSLTGPAQRVVMPQDASSLLGSLTFTLRFYITAQPKGREQDPAGRNH